MIRSAAYITIAFLSLTANIAVAAPVGGPSNAASEHGAGSGLGTSAINLPPEPLSQEDVDNMFNREIEALRERQRAAEARRQERSNQKDMFDRAAEARRQPQTGFPGWDGYIPPSGLTDSRTLSPFGWLREQSPQIGQHGINPLALSLSQPPDGLSNAASERGAKHGTKHGAGNHGEQNTSQMASGGPSQEDVHKSNSRIQEEWDRKHRKQLRDEYNRQFIRAQRLTEPQRRDREARRHLTKESFPQTKRARRHKGSPTTQPSQPSGSR